MILVVLTLGFAWFAGADPATLSPAETLRFVENRGQTDARVRYLSHGRGHTMFMTSQGITFTLLAAERTTDTAMVATDVIHLDFAGADTDVLIEGLNPLSGYSNYLIGSDPSAWRTNLPGYSQVRYAGLYPGIDLLAFGNEGRLQYDFVVAPGADPNVVRLRVRGASAVAVNPQGELIMTAASGQRVIQQKPFIYQDGPAGRNEIGGRYRLDRSHGIVSFDLDDYDRSRPLVIDPTVAWSTYLGGQGQDYATGVAVDSSNNVYVTGYTTSTDFPLQNPYQTQPSALTAYVTKFNPAGSALVYSTFVGGGGTDRPYAIVVDGAGAAYVAGSTHSTNFPTVNAYQGSLGGSSDAFVFKLAPAGNSLTYSTYFGGSLLDRAQALAVDSAGRAYITGRTESNNLPTKSAFQATRGSGSGDAFVARLSAGGNSLDYASYLGGDGSDLGNAIAVDSSNNVYVAGQTASNNFPTVGPIQGSRGGGDDVFVTKVNASGSSIAFSTYLGGGGHDRAFGLALASTNEPVICGQTTSSTFPLKDPIQDTQTGGMAFITHLTSTGAALKFSTFLGGTGSGDEARAIVMAANGDYHVAGLTNSTDFPTANPHQAALGGDYDAFLVHVAADTRAIRFSTFFGGSARDEAHALAVDGAGFDILAGDTRSTNFPVLNAFRATTADTIEGFVVKIRGTSGPSGYSYVIPSVAHLAGAAGSQWRTNVAVVSVGTGTASLGLTFTTSSSTRTRSFSLPAGATHEWNDILVSLFEYPAGARNSGSLLISSDQPLRITSRTYNQATTGTFGQYYPALRSGDGVTQGVRGIIPQLKHNASFRTNIGLVNLAETDCPTRITLYGPDGQQIGSSMINRTPEAWEWLQVDRAFEVAGAGTRDLGYAVIEVLAGGCEVWAYGSVVDNATNDPTTIPVLR